MITLRRSRLSSLVKTNIAPKNGYVVLLWSKPKESVNDFGLIIPDSKRRDEHANVIAVSKNSDLVVGDKVLFDKGKGTFVTDEFNNDIFITKEEDIFAVLED
jgi:co-chaperonin GroES (HSP10)